MDPARVSELQSTIVSQGQLLCTNGGLQGQTMLHPDFYMSNMAATAYP